MLVPPHFLVSTAFEKMRWKDEFRKWLPKLSIDSNMMNEVPASLVRLIIVNVRMRTINSSLGFVAKAPVLSCLKPNRQHNK